ncbi:MAG: hypothetical protein ABSH22_11675 [Tepidisphaeraceae bacterium]|jgi:hypothetical protein
MRTISGIINDGLTIDEPCTISGIVGGDITVTSRGVLTLLGMCKGKVVVYPGGQASVPGMASEGIHFVQVQPNESAVRS